MTTAPIAATETPTLAEEMAVGPARIRIDVHGGEPREHVVLDVMQRGEAAAFDGVAGQCAQCGVGIDRGEVAE
jgi:hypothetical protein